eukprot:124156-Hanusia_phi.AAC.4
MVQALEQDPQQAVSFSSLLLLLLLSSPLLSSPLLLPSSSQAPAGTTSIALRASRVGRYLPTATSSSSQARWESRTSSSSTRTLAGPVSAAAPPPRPPRLTAVSLVEGQRGEPDQAALARGRQAHPPGHPRAPGPAVCREPPQEVPRDCKVSGKRSEGTRGGSSEGRSEGRGGREEGQGS